MILLKDNIKYIDRTPEKGKKYFQAIECHNIETSNNLRTTVLIINIYIPTDEKDMAMGKIIAFLEASLKCHKQYEIIMGGDFNSTREHQIFKLLEKYYTIKFIGDEVEGPTRSQKYGQEIQESRIDFIISNKQPKEFKIEKTFST